MLQSDSNDPYAAAGPREMDPTARSSSGNLATRLQDEDETGNSRAFKIAASHTRDLAYLEKIEFIEKAQ